MYIPLEAVVSKWYGESEKMLAGEQWLLLLPLHDLLAQRLCASQPACRVVCWENRSVLLCEPVDSSRHGLLLD